MAVDLFHKIGQATVSKINALITALKAANNTWTGTNDFYKDVKVGTDSSAGSAGLSVGTNSKNQPLTVYGATTLHGDLSVNGTTTTVNSTNLDLLDNILRLNKGASASSAEAKDAGFLFERALGSEHATFMYEESNDRFELGLVSLGNISAVSLGNSVSLGNVSLGNLAVHKLLIGTRADTQSLGTLDDFVAGLTATGPTSFELEMQNHSARITVNETAIAGLGTASTKNVGTNANHVVQLDSYAKLPAIDGSQLTGISTVADLEDLTNVSSASASNGQVLSYNGSAWGPATLAPSGGGSGAVTKTASFTLSASENGKVINSNSGSRIDITIPAGLTAGFNCRVVQKGSGRVRFLTAGTTTLNSYYSTGSEPNAVIGRHGVVDLVNTSTNAYHLAGNYEYLFVYTNSWSNAFDGGASQEFRTSALSRPTGTWSNNIPYTLSAWVKPNATGGDGGVIGLFPSTASTSGSSYVGSFYHTSGTKYAWYQGNENQGGGAFTVGNWNHLVQIWDGTNLKGYINGVLVLSVSKANNGLGTGGTIAIHGSSRGRWNDRAPIGIDEISVWDTALTTGQIATLYNSGTPSDLTSLSPIGWWLMGDSQTGQTNGGTTPTTITDVGIGSHSKADGTLFGSATYSNLIP